MGLYLTPVWRFTQTLGYSQKIHWIVTWILPESPVYVKDVSHRLWRLCPWHTRNTPGKKYSSNPFEHCIALGDSSLIESFLSIIFTQINHLTLQSVEISLHWSIIIRIPCFTHALCHMNRFAKFYECFGSKLWPLVELQDHLWYADLLYRLL